MRYRFADFVISPRQRLLLRDGRPVPLIPKYFDLLHLLVVRRHEAVAKDAIFAEVWSDVIVTDGALSQAVRTLRRTLGDDVRDPKFIRTVSRHGYQFVWAEVIEEPDEPMRPVVDRGRSTPAEGVRGVDDAAREARQVAPPAGNSDAPSPAAALPWPAVPAASIDALAERLLHASDPEEARDVAEQLHALGTGEALATLTARPQHGPAIAVMRDARWSVPGAGDVPLLRDPEAGQAITSLIRLRVADVQRVVALRWAGAAVSGALGGVAAGVLGGLALMAAPASNARPHSLLALAVIGAVAGAVGAGGIAAGLVAAEVVARSRRTLALIVAGATSGLVVAAAAAVLLQAMLEALFGLRLEHEAGALDGLVLGGAAGLGYGLTTATSAGGLAAPHGSRRLTAVLVVALACGVAAVGLALSGRPLVGGLVHEIARRAQNTELVLSPLGRLIGEPDFGRRTQTWLSAFEGAAFGAALAWGMTRRPKIARNA